MRPVRRDEILDYVTYEEQRSSIQADALAEKAARRIHVGDELTFLFENTKTIRYQILEMVRVERIVKEADILHELETYNEILGGPGELGCTLLIEIPDPDRRPARLRELRTLPQHLYVRLPEGGRVYAQYDERQVDDERLSSVQFLKFDTKGEVPVAIGADHPALTVEAALDDAQRAALEQDLQTVDSETGRSA